jgi:hypothetical protein
MTLTHAWQVRFNESGIVPRPRIDEPVRSGDRRRAARADPGLPPRLRAGRPHDRRVSTAYGATVRTLRQYIRSYHDWLARSATRPARTRTSSRPDQN